MRKAVALAALAVLLGSSVARAGDPDVGCGWGTRAFKGQSGVVPKVLAATTNSFVTQTFGISSGTAGCSQGGIVKAELRVQMYAGANIDKLRGRHGCRPRGNARHAGAPHGRCGRRPPGVLPPRQDATSAHCSRPSQVDGRQMLATLERLMASDEQLAKYVS